MIICPYCSSENIEGVDECEGCGQPLTHLHLPTPATHVERCLLKDSVRELTPKTPITVQADQPVGEVLNSMVDLAIGCVVVVSSGQLVGIFSERDALLKLNENAASLLDQPVEKFMTPNPEKLASKNKIAFAVQRMDLGGYRHLPVVDGDGDLNGIISVRDILRYLTEKMTIADSETA